jgi:hypothetical protein
MKLNPCKMNTNNVTQDGDPKIIQIIKLNVASEIRKVPCNERNPFISLHAAAFVAKQ